VTPEREREAARICEEALDRPVSEREAFVAVECAGDDALRREVDSLLSQQSKASAFLGSPALEVAAERMVRRSALGEGQQIGPYQIQGLLGAGGMGEVYRARDTKLGRDVAIKIPPRLFTSDPDRLGRFEREARLLALLNHPNIGAIYGLEDIEGTPALVLELVDGPTLADRVAKGPLPLREALTIAGQIAGAFEAAHEKGIIHRDLKPANIKITPDGGVKVLDFGLAKVASSGSRDGITQSSAVIVGGTREGVILGTAAYMSPEQALGQPADARSDIWAFGVVLYEMLTGKPGFGGETTVEVLSNVLKADLDWHALPASTPPAVRSLMRRCVQKDRNRRLRDIADARFQIEEALNEPEDSAAGGGPAPVHITRERLLWVAALTAVVVGAVAFARYTGGRQPQSNEVRFEINAPPTTEPTSLAVSPDGTKLVFVATSEGTSRLWLRPLDDAVSARPLTGTENAQFPFWSPDSRSVGFVASFQLKRIDLGSGSVQVLAAAAMGGAWSQDGTILFSRGPGNSLLRISAAGGEPTEVIQSTLQAAILRSPQFFSDDRHFLFHAQGTKPGVYVGQLGTSKPPTWILDALAAAYTSSGHLLFVRQGTLFAQRFDPVRLALTGDPIAVAEPIVVHSRTGAALSASVAGPIAYRTGSPTLQSHFVWFDRSGKTPEVVAGSESAGFNSALSPDGRRLAISENGGAAADIWVLDLNRGVRSRFTFDEAFELTPVWSPDGRRIAFSSNRKGTFDLYVKSADGIGDETLLETGDAGPPSDWSRDGRFILRTRQRSATNDDLWALALDGDRTAFPVVETPFNESNGQFSPDGKWIAYQSNESGLLEIYVQPFPGPAQKTRISSNGGAQVRWRSDGHELFYLAPDNRLMAVAIRIDSKGVDAGTPVPLFATQVGGDWQNNYARNYMVSRDGQRFLVDTLREVTLPITVILNWKPRP
jgi:serine/threonine protein kinase